MTNVTVQPASIEMAPVVTVSCPQFPIASNGPDQVRRWTSNTGIRCRLRDIKRRLSSSWLRHKLASAPGGLWGVGPLSSRLTTPSRQLHSRAQISPLPTTRFNTNSLSTGGICGRKRRSSLVWVATGFEADGPLPPTMMLARP